MEVICYGVFVICGAFFFGLFLPITFNQSRLTFFRRADAVIDDLVLVALDEVLDLDAAGADEGLAGGEGLAEGVVFEAVEDFVGGVEEGDVLGLAVGDGALEFDVLGVEFGAFILLGAGDGGGFLIAVLPFGERFLVFDEAFLAVGKFVVEVGDGFRGGGLVGSWLV